MMSVKGEPLFSGPALEALVSRRDRLLEQRTELVKAQGLDEGTIEDAVRELEREFAFQVPRLREDEIKVERRSARQMADAVGSALFGNASQTEVLELRVEIPFDGGPELFSCPPAMGLSHTPPRANIESGRLCLFYTVSDGGEDRADSARKNDLIVIRQCLKRLAREAAEYNAALGPKVRELLQPKPAGEKKTRKRITSSVSINANTNTLHEPPNLQSPMISFGPEPREETREEVKEPSESSPPRATAPRPDPDAPLDLKGEPAIKYIVELDLVGYSNVCHHLEESLGARAVQFLNQQIHGLIEQALAAAGERIGQVPMTSTGDGAIVVFDGAETAVRFAEAVHAAADRHNRGKTVEFAKRIFRVGVAKGEIILDLERAQSGEVIKFHMAGMAIAVAVRLESAARPGEVLICHHTYNDLSENLRSNFGPQETVKGKREETFPAHRKSIIV